MEGLICAVFAFLAFCQGQPALPPTPPPPPTVVELATPTAIVVAAPTPTPPPPPPPPTATPQPAQAARVVLPPMNQIGEIERGRRDTNKVAFTFDAGAGSANALSILDQLKAAGVRSTMFVTGHWADRFPDLIRRMAADGHEFGNHSYTHRDFPTLTEAQMLDELNRTDDAVRRATNFQFGTKPWFRPPSGARTARTNAFVAQQGYVNIYWTLDSWDWRPEIGAGTVYDRVATMTTGGSIIVSHVDSATTASVLTRQIQALRARGFQLVTLTELFSE